MSNFTLIKVKQSLGYLRIIQFARFFFFWSLMFISAPFLSLQPAMALFRCPPAPGSAGSVNLRREQLAWWVTWSLFFHAERENLRLNRFAVQTDHRDKARAAACANRRRSCASCSNLSWCQMTWKKTEIDEGWKKILLIGTTTCVFTYLKGFSQNLLPSFGPCLFATFTSVYYAAPAIVPHQMDLIQIVKMSD